MLTELPSHLHQCYLLLRDSLLKAYVLLTQFSMFLWEESVLLLGTSEQHNCVHTTEVHIRLLDLMTVLAFSCDAKQKSLLILVTHS